MIGSPLSITRFIRVLAWFERVSRVSIFQKGRGKQQLERGGEGTAISFSIEYDPATGRKGSFKATLFSEGQGYCITREA